MTPLNGTRTHPLSEAALDALRSLDSDGPAPTQQFNPGVVDRLLREELVRIVDRPSPYKTHKGRPIAHLEIAEAGRARVELSMGAGPRSPRR